MPRLKAEAGPPEVAWGPSAGPAEFLSWLAVEKGRLPNTVSAYRRDLRAYEAWLAARGLSVADVTEDVVQDYLTGLRATGRKASSVARAFVAVRNLHRFLLDEGATVLDPTTDVGSPRIPQSLPRALAEEEVARLLGAVTGHGPAARRDRALLELLYGTGVRISEAVGLSLPDLDLEGHVLRAMGKGAKERVVPIGRMAREALAEWLSPGGRGALVPPRWARRSDSEAVFLNRRGGRLSRQGAWRVVRHYGERVGLGGRLTPHVLRHSCATHMLDHGADIRVVQELLGHASLATTQRYTKVGTDRLWAVYDAAHPRARLESGSKHHPTGVTWSGMAGDLAFADLRATLETERDELRKQLAELGFGAAVGDHYDANFADSSQVTAERGEAEALASKLRGTLTDVERALAKLDNGTFGTCEACGQAIPEARLEAIPAARFCITCASKR